MTSRFVASHAARLFGFAAAIGLSAFGAARAETLADAIALAYQSNPTLQSQRALQRGLDETYVQARAGWRPTASATGTANWSQTNLGREYSGQTAIVPTGTGQYAATNSTSYQENYGTGAITAIQPLYSGGKVAATVKAAEATVLAGRENLRLIESQILQSVITAYEDTRRDAQILNIRADNTNVLKSQLEETQAKFGDAHRRRSGPGPTRQRPGPAGHRQGPAADQPRQLRRRRRTKSGRAGTGAASAGPADGGGPGLRRRRRQ
jgi:outer membrane protein